MAKGNRKDHRGRVLPPNVSQKSDQRYIWRKMIDGKQYVLTDNDLNELKKKIVTKEAQLQNGIYSNPTKITLNEWFLKWMDVYKGNLKITTRENYLTAWKNYVKDSQIGNMQISKIKRMHLAEKYNIAQKRQGKSRIPGIGRDSLVQIWYRTRKNIPEIILSLAIFPMASIRTESRNFLRPSQMTVFPLFRV